MQRRSQKQQVKGDEDPLDSSQSQINEEWLTGKKTKIQQKQADKALKSLEKFNLQFTKQDEFTKIRDRGLRIKRIILIPGKDEDLGSLDKLWRETHLNLTDTIYKQTKPAEHQCLWITLKSQIYISKISEKFTFSEWSPKYKTIPLQLLTTKEPYRSNLCLECIYNRTKLNNSNPNLRNDNTEIEDNNNNNNNNTAKFPTHETLVIEKIAVSILKDLWAGWTLEDLKTMYVYKHNHFMITWLDKENTRLIGIQNAMESNTDKTIWKDIQALHCEYLTCLKKDFDKNLAEEAKILSVSNEIAELLNTHMVELTEPKDSEEYQKNRDKKKILCDRFTESNMNGNETFNNLLEEAVENCYNISLLTRLCIKSSNDKQFFIQADVVIPKTFPKFWIHVKNLCERFPNFFKASELEI